MKRVLLALVTMALALCSFTVMAQSTLPAENAWLDGLVNFLIGFGNANPKMAPIFAILFLIGVAAKIARSAIEEFVLASPSLKDDEKLAKAKENKVVKTVLFVLDLLVRFKTPGSK